MRYDSVEVTKLRGMIATLRNENSELRSTLATEKDRADKAEYYAKRLTLHLSMTALNDKDLKIASLTEKLKAVNDALEDLVQRCDGDEGVRADGSNIQTIKAHAVLDTNTVMDESI